MATHSSIFAWKPLGQRSLVDYSPCGRQELDMAERLSTPKNGAVVPRIVLNFHLPEICVN